MLGQPKPRCLDQPIAVSLEELVPADNFYRHLETKLDLSFVRDWTREQYAERGRPSIDPVVFFKLQADDPPLPPPCGTRARFVSAPTTTTWWMAASGASSWRHS